MSLEVSKGTLKTGQEFLGWEGSRGPREGWNPMVWPEWPVKHSPEGGFSVLAGGP
jgi:hypothetical protein